MTIIETLYGRVSVPPHHLGSKDDSFQETNTWPQSQSPIKMK